MLIREATTADVPAVAQVHLDSWDAAKEGLDLPTRRTREQRTEHWTTFLDEGGGDLFDGGAAGDPCDFLTVGRAEHAVEACEAAGDGGEGRAG